MLSSQVGRDINKGAHELSFKGGIERTAMDGTCYKLREGPYMSQKRPLVLLRIFASMFISDIGLKLSCFVISLSDCSIRVLVTL